MGYVLLEMEDLDTSKFQDLSKIANDPLSLSIFKKVGIMVNTLDKATLKALQKVFKTYKFKATDVPVSEQEIKSHGSFFTLNQSEGSHDFSMDGFATDLRTRKIRRKKEEKYEFCHLEDFLKMLKNKKGRRIESKRYVHEAIHEKNEKIQDAVVLGELRSALNKIFSCKGVTAP